MKAIIYGFLAVVIIGLGASAVLKNIGFSSAERFTGPNVRVE